MPQIRISQLPAAARLTGGERLAGVQNAASVAVRGDQLLDLFARRGRPAYVGPVASRTFVHRAFTASNKQMMIRTYHRAAEDISEMQIVEANWYANNGTETAPGGAITVRASIEYPLNQCTPVSYADQPTGTVADGQNLASDFVTVAIPRGAFFAVRRFIQAPAGICFQSVSDSNDRGFGPDVFGYAASGLTDQTMTAAPVTSAQAAGPCSYPAAILARVRQPSFGLIGDSRMLGATTTNATIAVNGAGDSGEVARALGSAGFAVMHASLYGTTAQQFVASSARQRELLGSCSHIVVGRAINDITGGRTLAQIQADLLAIAGMFPRAQVIAVTSPPTSTSSDAWASLGNQTPAATNAVRVALNAWKRTVPAPFADCWEIADLVESTRGSGLWKPGLTDDGVHENVAGYAAIETAAAWNSRLVDLRR